MNVVMSVLHTGRLYPAGNYFWYLFLLDHESTPGSKCGLKDYDNEKLQ